MNKKALVRFSVAVLLALGLGVATVNSPKTSAVSGSVTVTIQNKYLSGNAFVDGAKGRITAPGIDCPGDCSETYTEGQTITFTRTPEVDWRSGWDANWDCAAGTSLYSSTCVKVIKGDQPMYAAGYYYNLSLYWALDNLNLSVQKTGTGSGTVSGNGINCGSVCSVKVYKDSNVTLTATPAAGSTFSGWQAGSYCAIGYPGGKGGDTSTPNPSANCTITSITGASATAVAKFDAIPGYVPPASSTPKSNSAPAGTSPVPSTTQTTEQIPAIKVDAPPSLALQLNGKKYDEKSTYEFPSGKTVVLGGKTVPGAIIKLFIFSTPREATVNADSSGVWTYSVTSLEPGNHRVEAQVTDPATNVTSARAKIASFSVGTTVAAKQASSVEAQTTSRTGMLLVIAVAGLLAILFGVWMFVRTRRMPLA